MAFESEEREGAFTRLDLLCASVVLLLGAGVLLPKFVGESGRVRTCQRNLVVLGQAFDRYANDHQGRLPPAVVQFRDEAVTWDVLVAPYIKPWRGQTNTATWKSELVESVADRLVCPSDQFLRGHPRTYAMTGHSMKEENWPPSQEDDCGVGLSWDNAAVQRLLGKKSLERAGANLDEWSLVKVAEIPDPANTALLTELAQPNNQLRSTRAVVNHLREQSEQVDRFSRRFHFGKFNYLMMDGHVELLSRNQLDVFDAGGGIWTVRVGD